MSADPRQPGQPFSIERTASQIAAHARFEGYCKAIGDVARLAQRQGWEYSDYDLSLLLDEAKKKHDEDVNGET